MQLTLYCFPYAGAGISAYRNWPDIYRGIAVRPVGLPGRDSRWREPAHRTIGALVDDLAHRVPAGDGAFAFFGHSMGALLAHALTARLGVDGRPEPRHLFVSAVAAPHRLPPWPAADDDLLAEMVERHTAVLGAERAAEMAELVRPTLAADRAVVQSSRTETPPRVSVPLTAFVASDDTAAPADAVAAWSECAGAGFALRSLPGGHLSVLDDPEPILAEVVRACAA